MKKLLGLMLALALLCSTALATELSPVAEGEEASDFEVTLSDGTAFKLSEQRGKVVDVYKRQGQQCQNRPEKLYYRA